MQRTGEENDEDPVVRLCVHWQHQGPDSQNDLCLYKHVVIPKVTYAVVLWWSRAEVTSTRTELQRLQRAACIMITGAMRATPLGKALELASFSIVVEAAALTTAYRIPKPD